MWRSLFGLLLLCPLAAIIRAENICRSIEVRKLSDFDQLRNCSLVVGHVSIANLQLPGNVNLTQLQTNVTEITDYLLIYHTTGLLTAEYIFPKLRLIRGRELLFNQYSFVVYENRNLRELGLLQLLRIQNGKIRIENNPTLCYVDTIDWVYLLGNSTTQHFSIRGNRSPNHCPLCNGLDADYDYLHKNMAYCWRILAPQLKLTRPKVEGCPASCGRFGCDVNGTCCDHNCLTGCSSQNCTLCGNYQRNGRCVNQCIASYELNKRLCIGSKECQQLNLIPLAQGLRCVDQCPKNHKPIIDANGGKQCDLECRGLYHVKRIEDLKPLRDCVSIQGSLIIELVDIKEPIVKALEQALGNIKEITGYLKVIHSTPLMSLTFLSNLDTIRGDELIETKYALYVVNNYHLEHIWPTNRQVAIQHGTIFFHLNPRLCYEKILNLQPALKSLKTEISVADVSPNSNGERMICGEDVSTLDPQIQDINATAVSIVLDFVKYEYVGNLIGYTYHYMEAPKRNITMYDGRHGCGHDNWLMDVSIGKNRRHMISNLKPYTQYAYFVKSMSPWDYHRQMEAYSKIQYFRTLPSKPSPPRRLYGISEIHTQIMVHWWPPQRPNGNITKYIIDYELHNLTSEENKTKSYGMEKPLFINDPPNCECNDQEPYYSGPQPEVEKYFNKTQTTYEEALPNLIYVSRRRPPVKQDKFEKVVDFTDLISGRPMSQVVENPTTTTTTTTTTTEAPSSANVTKPREVTAELYEIFRLQVEERTRNIQDMDQEKFRILHDPPKCHSSDVSVANQLEQKCVVEEEIKGFVVPGNQQYYNMTNLLQNQYYRIYVRACVDGVVNGCSNPAILTVRTISAETFREIY
ncbi:insulin-like peptide receptor isoform X2 [Drosophila albomicans]|uniref:receptor protein-tyrosine kinase n=1 Tax=Drosophila albomicans TaxID=7291 RepID=A0A6P8ZDG9_DROAB|nr:insulin-like peptide receptor isoform X2 [Drosophila albomicans]